MNLQIGQLICIPCHTVPPPTVCPGGIFYTIRAGDTIYLIAQRYGRRSRQYWPTLASIR